LNISSVRGSILRTQWELMIKLNNADHTYKSNLMRLQQRILINWTLNPEPYKEIQCNHDNIRKYIKVGFEYVTSPHQ
jgi:hypothetical protein